MAGKAEIHTPKAILDFWLGLPPVKWFAVDAELDGQIRSRFLPLVKAARAGKLAAWEDSAEGSLALLILLDQFPRNLFRGKAEAFASDAQARELARRALDKGHDLGVPIAARAFFYLPFMHSEELADQELCVALVAGRLGTHSVNHPFALGHRDTIARFGRFPGRNAALGRKSTKAEAEFLKSGQRF